MDKNKLLKESKTFCVAPWMSVYVHPNGDVAPCCIWDFNKSLGNVNKNTLSEIYTSETTKEVKRKMLNGETVSQCSLCTNLENINQESGRIRFNNEHGKCVDYIDDDLNSDPKFHFWDIRISNLCNFKCRMCTHDLSSSWYNDSIYLKYFKKDDRKPIITLDDTEKFLDELSKHYDYVDEIYFAGGEPLISDYHYDLLDNLIKKDKSPKLKYSTNLSKLTFKDKHIFDYWKHFNRVTLFVSLDGFGEIGKYIRNGFKEETFIDNAKKTSEFLTKSDIFYILTYGALNYLHVFDVIKKLFDEGLIDKEINYDGRRMLGINPIIEPSSLSCKWLPESVKNNFKDRMDDIQDYMSENAVSENVKTEIMGLLNSIYTFSVSDIENIDKQKQYGEFLHFNSKLDKIRNENINDVYGEFLNITNFNE
jgi:radical SAM protein with 4Fe4S-binding SPASM domain